MSNIQNITEQFKGLSAEELYPVAEVAERVGNVLRSEFKKAGYDPRAAPLYADTLRMAFVHHTAGTNDYTRLQAPAVVRGIARLFGAEPTRPGGAGAVKIGRAHV